jgi:hypothetical protein
MSPERRRHLKCSPSGGRHSRRRDHVKQTLICDDHKPVSCE